MASVQDFVKAMEEKVKGMSKAEEIKAVLAAGVSYEVNLGFLLSRMVYSHGVYIRHTMSGVCCVLTTVGHIWAIDDLNLSTWHICANLLATSRPRVCQSCSKSWKARRPHGRCLS